VVGTESTKKEKQNDDGQDSNPNSKNPRENGSLCGNGWHASPKGEPTKNSQRNYFWKGKRRNTPTGGEDVAEKRWEKRVGKKETFHAAEVPLQNTTGIPPGSKTCRWWKKKKRDIVKWEEHTRNFANLREYEVPAGIKEVGRVKPKKKRISPKRGKKVLSRRGGQGD